MVKPKCVLLYDVISVWIFWRAVLLLFVFEISCIEFLLSSLFLFVSLSVKWHFIVLGNLTEQDQELDEETIAVPLTTEKVKIQETNAEEE